jgi:hypothetical protein
MVSRPTIRAVEILDHDVTLGRFEAQVRATMSDGEKVALFTYYADELVIHKEELIGLTVSEAREFKDILDEAYLQTRSPAANGRPREIRPAEETVFARELLREKGINVKLR